MTMRNLDKEEIQALKGQLAKLTKTNRNYQTPHGNLRSQKHQRREANIPANANRTLQGIYRKVRFSRTYQHLPRRRQKRYVHG